MQVFIGCSSSNDIDEVYLKKSKELAKKEYSRDKYYEDIMNIYKKVLGGK